MSRIINIYLTPDQETAASEQEVADYVGVSLETLRDRLKKMGPDHYLTYYPGSIPSSVRRFRHTGRRHSKLDSIRRNGKTIVTPEYAKMLIVGLILLSQKHYKSSRCKESRAFLLNQGGMLEWYLEPFSGIDHEAFVERMKVWVESN